MLHDDDRIDDAFQGDAYAPFVTPANAKSTFRPPGYALYGFVALALFAVLAVNELAQTAKAGLVFASAALVCGSTLVCVAIVSEKRGSPLVRPLVVTLGLSSYVTFIAGIAWFIGR